MNCPDPERTTGSGIVIPDSAGDKPDQGQAIAAGNGKLLSSGELRPLAMKTGDRVLFGKYAGQAVKIDGAEALVLCKEDVTALIENGAARRIHSIRYKEESRNGEPRPERPQRGVGAQLRPPTVTKDGVSVAKEIELKDEYGNIGAQIAEATSDYDREKLQERKAISGLKGDNHNHDQGINIVLRAVEEPLRQIVTNAGDEVSVVVNKVIEGSGNYGYNAGIALSPS